MQSDPGRRRRLLTTCVDAPSTHGGRARAQALLEAMYDAARPISIGHAIRLIGAETLREVFPDYRWRDRREGMRLIDEPCLKTYRSTFDGIDVIVIQQSRIEHIFA